VPITQTTSPLKQTRKRKANSIGPKSIKKRKHIITQPCPPVLLLDETQMLQELKAVPVADLAKLRPVSVMPGWKVKYHPSLAMHHADDENTEVLLDSDQEGEDRNVDSSALEEEALARALHANLGKLGIGANHIPQDLLLKMAAKMMSGDVEDDEGADILEELVQGVHATKEEEEEDARDGFSKWVSGQLKPARQDDVDPKLPLPEQDENQTPAVSGQTPSSLDGLSTPRGSKRKRAHSTTTSRKKTSQLDHVSAKG